MAKQRCKDTTLDSFFGRFLYEQKVPERHFLRKLDEVIDWSRFTKWLLRYYRGKGEVGQSPYNPVLILKMLLLSYLYNISERQVEMVANDSFSVAYFLGQGADEKAPDHSTLTLFPGLRPGQARTGSWNKGARRPMKGCSMRSSG